MLFRTEPRPPEIFSLSDWIKMPRIHAPSDPTDMVQDTARWDWSTQQLECRSVCSATSRTSSDRAFPDSEHRVPLVVEPTRPRPTGVSAERRRVRQDVFAQSSTAVMTVNVNAARGSSTTAAAQASLGGRDRLTWSGPRMMVGDVPRNPGGVVRWQYLYRAAAAARAVMVALLAVSPCDSAPGRQLRRVRDSRVVAASELADFGIVLGAHGDRLAAPASAEVHSGVLGNPLSPSAAPDVDALRGCHLPTVAPECFETGSGGHCGR